MTFYVLWPFIRSLGPKTTASTVHLSHSSHSTPEKRHNKGIRETEIPPKKASLGQQAQSPASIRSYWRILLLPIIPALAPIFQPPILPKPLTEPFTHSTAPIRILSSVRSEYSGVVLVGEALPPTTEAARTGSVSEPHSLRYLRAGHSLLGGVWIGDRVYRRDGLGPLSFDQSGAPIGDSIYGAFVLQEAARLAHTSNGRPRKDALIMYVK